MINKIKKENVKIQYEYLGDWDKLKLQVYTDAAFKNGEDKIRSVSGKIILLTNERGKSNILYAKSSTIKRVCKSIKSAETRSLEEGLEIAIGLARTLDQIKNGKKYDKK